QRHARRLCDDEDRQAFNAAMVSLLEQAKPSVIPSQRCVYHYQENRQMKVETGVIAAAGSGTRMLPVPLGYPKELLPVINKPALQLIIEEYIDSGIKKIIVVTGANPEPLYKQYDLTHLPPRGKYTPMDEFADKLAGIEIIFEAQEGPYG